MDIKWSSRQPLYLFSKLLQEGFKEKHVLTWNNKFLDHEIDRIQYSLYENPNIERKLGSH